MTFQRKRTYWKIGIWVAVLAFLSTLYLLRHTLFPLFVAFALAYACSPLVDTLEKRGMPRTLTVALLLASLAGLIVLFFSIVVPAVVREMQGFLKDLPELAGTALTRVSGFAQRFGVQIPVDVEGVMERLRGTAQESSMQTLSPVMNVAKRIFSGVAGFLMGFLNVLIIPIFFFYALRDFHNARRYTLGLVPPRKQPYARSLFERIDRVFAGYIRGQLLVASILAVVFAIALPIMGIRFGLFIGIISGFLNIIPYLGQITGLALALMMALVDFDGIGKIIGILALFGVMNFIEGNFITPKIVGDKVGLSPLWAILSLIVGGSAAGLTGMILAIPVVGSIKVIMHDVIASYKKSDLFNHPASAEGLVKSAK